MQSSMLQSIAAVEYFPAIQGVQASFPVWDLYVPTAQIAQAVPSLANPALHVQAVAMMPPAGHELEFARHTSHAIFPDNEVVPIGHAFAMLSVQYMPAGQIVHCNASALETFHPL